MLKFLYAICGVHCLFTKIYEYSSFYHNCSHRYALYTRKANLVDALRRIISAYNHRIHSALHGLTPDEVLNNAENEWRLWELRFPHLARNELPQRALLDPRAPPLGSFVRVAHKRTEPGRHFTKETDPTAPTFSMAVYQVVGYNLMYVQSNYIYMLT